MNKAKKKGTSRYARKVEARKRYIAKGHTLQEWRDGRRDGSIVI